MHLARACLSFVRHGTRPKSPQMAFRRHYSQENASSKNPSAHAQFYSSMLPDMVPVAILGSAVYLGLRLLQAELAHERYLDEAVAKVAALEQDVESLRTQNQAQAASTDDVPAPRGEAKKRGWLW